jgi:hypothetical protein
MAGREKRKSKNEKAKQTAKVNKKQALEANIVAEGDAAQLMASSSFKTPPSSAPQNLPDTNERKNFFVNFVRRKRSYGF